jgi:hypothetical protein
LLVKRRSWSGSDLDFDPDPDFDLDLDRERDCALSDGGGGPDKQRILHDRVVDMGEDAQTKISATIRG